MSNRPIVIVVVIYSLMLIQICTACEMPRPSALGKTASIVTSFLIFQEFNDTFNHNAKDR